MPLARFDSPFEHPDWIFEPKLDGFRAVAYVEGGACRPAPKGGRSPG
jgi:ATP-dependent DNA ligase